ncbi:MAG: hypothetical protein IT184_13545 [Acidobacteria bacterium]|nr:hypothetical protein [Acidobacteriota bacterium]
MSSLVLRTSELEAERARLSDLEARLAERERELARLKIELHHLQTRYLSEIGVLYRELSELEAAVIAAEVRAGLRPPPSPQEADGETADPSETASADSCANPAAPSVDLKRMFRDVAKAVHPDLALDELARCRRHSLMAEANRAYAERDEDRLRLILSTWVSSPEAVTGDGPEADVQRIERRIAAIHDRLQGIDAEVRELRRSAIWRLKGKIDQARRQGWDLFAEMLLQVKREIVRARARLVRLAASGGSPADGTIRGA